jgi:hypothetical protein
MQPIHLTIFSHFSHQNHPDGVITVKFEEPIAAGLCIEVWNELELRKPILTA